MAKRIGRRRIEAILRDLNSQDQSSTGSRSGLKGFEMPAFQLQRAKYFGFHDDFDVVNGSQDLAVNEDMAQATAISTGRWDVVIGGTNDGVTLSSTEPGGVVVLNTGDSDNEVTHMHAPVTPFVLDAANARNVWWETRVKLEDVDKTGIFIGLCSANGAVETDIDNIEDGVGFYMKAGDASTALKLNTSVGDSETATDVDTVLADNKYTNLAFYFNGTVVEAYVNGILKASTGLTLPTDGTILFPSIIVSAEGTGDKDIFVDYMTCCMER